MIENLLVDGAMIRWRKPITVAPPAMDGAIAASVNAPSPMTYLGSTQAQPRRGLFNRAPRVYQVPPNTLVPHTWLDYITGRTAYVVQGTDVLTGFMSGCLIARGTYNNAMCVFHMGTVDIPPAVNQLVKTGFRNELPDNATGFYPHAAWLAHELEAVSEAMNRAIQIIALVTSAGTFYSILLCYERNFGEWTVSYTHLTLPTNREV